MHARLQTPDSRLQTDSDRPTRAIRLLFYAFIFSLPFETALEGWLEPTTILGALLLLSTLLQPGLFLRWPPKGFWCFLVYLYIFVTLSVLEPSQYRSLTILNVFLLAQLTVLGWIAFSILSDRKTAERALLTFGIGCVVLALLQISGVASRAVEAESAIVRVTALGFHPNNLARILMLGLLSMIGLTFGRSKSLLRPIFISWPFIVVIGAALIQTGSRGGLLALAAGIMTLVLRRGTIGIKILNTIILLGILGFLLLGRISIRRHACAF